MILRKRCSIVFPLLFLFTLIKLTNIHAAVFDPTDSISYSGTAGFCPGKNLKLTAKYAPNGATYQWKKNGADIAGEKADNYVVTVAGDYTVVVNGTVNYPVVTIAAYNKPTAAYSFSPDNVCVTTRIQFNNTSTGASNYMWDFSDPNSSAGTTTDSDPYHRFIGNLGASTQTFAVKLVASNTDGCSDSVTKIVTLKQGPGTELKGTGVSGTTFKVCANVASSMNFVNNSSTTATNTNYKIEWGDGASDFSIATFSTTTHTYSVGNHDLLFIVTGNNGCIDTTKYTAFVGSNPSVTIGNPGNTNICSDASLTFPINTGTNPPGTTYTLSFNDGSPDSTFSHPAASSFVTKKFLISSCGVSSSDGTNTYANSFKATLKASNPCNTSSGTVVPIYVSEKPNALFSISPRDSICVNTSATFTNTSGSYRSVSGTNCVNGNSVWVITPSIGWSVTSGNVGSDNGLTDATLWNSGSNTLSIKFTSAGTYSIKLKIGNELCGNSEITKTICVNPTPTAAFSLDNISGCTPVAVTTTNNSSAPNCGTNSYTWSVSYTNSQACSPNGLSYTLNGGTSLNSQAPKFSFINPGVYTLGLLVTAPGGACSATATTQTVTVQTVPKLTLASSGSVCQNANYSPTLTPVNCYTAAPTYAWSMPGASVTTSSSASPGPFTYSTSGAKTITVDATNACGTTTATQTVTVNPAPTVTVPSNSILCATAATGNLNFTPSISPGSTITWTNNTTAIGLGSGATGSSISSFNTTNNTSSPVTATISVKATANGCTGPTTSFTITVNPTPSAPTATTSLSYCKGATASPLTATAAGSNTLTWYTGNNPLTGAASAITPSTTSSSPYYVTQTNSYNCESAPTTVQVNVNSPIVNNTIGSDQTICSGSTPSSITQSGSISGGNNSYTYSWESSTDNGNTWSIISGLGSTGSSYSPGALTQTTIYRRTVISGPCSSVSSAVTVTVLPALSNNTISASQTICNGTSPNLITGSLPTGGTGTYAYQWQSSTTNAVNSFSNITGAISPDYQPGILNTTTYYRRVVTSSCTNTSNVVTITINTKPVMNTITNINACTGSSVGTITFSSTPTATTYTWSADNTDAGTAISGSGNITSFTATNTANPKVPVITTITVKGTSVLNGVSCDGSTTNFKITVLPKISITPLNDVTVCSGSTVPSLTPVPDASNFSGATINYNWTVSGAGTSLTNGTAAANIPAYTTTNNGLTELTTTVTVTPRYIYNALTCSGNTDDYQVLVKPVPTANAGADKSFCGATSTTLSGNNLAAGQTGLWTQTSGPNTATFSNTGIATPILTDLIQGDYIFNWKVSNGGTCADANDAVSVKVRNTITVAAAGPDNNRCDFNSAKDSFLLAANAAATPYETGTWSVVSSPTGSTPVIRNISGPTTYFVFDKAGTYNLKWTITNDIGCTLSADNVIFNVYDKPKAGAVLAASSVCTAGSIPVSATSAVGSVLKWQYNPAPVNDNIWIDASNSANTTYTFNNVVTAFDARIIMQSAGFANGCTTTDTSAVVSIAVDAASVGGTTAAPATVCINNNNGTLTLTGHTGSVLRWESSINNGSTWSTIANTTGAQAYTNLTTTTLYRAIVKSGVCNSINSSTTQITVVNTVTPSNAGTDQKLCAAGSVNLNGNIPTVGTGSWSQISGPAAVISNTASASPTVTGLQPNSTYVFRWLITGQGNCPSSQDDVQIIDRPALGNAAAGADQTICDLVTTKSTTLTATPVSFPSFQTGTWSVAPIPPAGSTPAFQSTTQHNTQFTLNRSGTYNLVWTITDDACPLSRDTVVIRVYDKPAAGSFGGSQTLCEGSALNIPIGSGTVGNVFKWQIQSLPVDPNNWHDTAVIGNTVQFTNIKTAFAVRYIMQSLGAANNCGTKDTSATYSVFVSPTTVPGILTQDTTVCHTLNAGTLDLKNYTGNIVRWETSTDNGANWNVSTNTSSQFGYAALTQTTLYRVQVKSGVCPSKYSDTSDVNVVGPLSAADAGKDNGYCGTAAINLQANTPKSGEIGTWTQLKGSPVIFSDVNVPSSQIGNVKIGAYSFEWMINNNVCPVKRDTVQIQILPDLFNAVDTLAKNICQGQSAQIKGQPASGGDGTYSFQWQRSSDNTNWTNIPNAVSQDLNFTPTVSLYVRRILQSATCTDISPSAYILVKPSLGSFIASDSLSTCFPFTVKFTNLTLPSLATSWDFGDGFNGFGDTITHTFTSIGSYTVTMVAQHPGGCTYTATKAIVVSGPTGSGQYDKAPVCGLKPVRFEATYNDADSIRWHFGDGTLLTTKEKIIYHTYNSAGPYLPTLELMAGAGGVCKTIIKGIDTIKVDRIKAGFTSAGVENCGATAIAFTDTTNAYYGIAKWSWNFGDNNISSVKNPIHDYLNTGNYNISLIAESALGCKDTLNKPLSLHVRDIPKITVTADADGCAGKQVNYIASVTSVDAIQSNLWQFSNSKNATGLNYTNTYFASGNYTAVFISITVSGCSDTVSKNIVIHPTPKTKTIDDVTVCKGQSLQLNTTGAETYQWSPITGLTCINCASPVITPAATVTYIVTGSNQFGCSEKDTATVKVIQPTKLKVSAGDSVCIGESVQLSASGAQVYHWTPATGLNNDKIATPVASPQLSTIYRVVGQDTLSCFTDTAYVIIGVGTQPTLDLGPDKTLQAGTLLPLTSIVKNGIITDWKWTPNTNLSCSTCPVPIATIKDEIMYAVSATTAYGCNVKDSIRIKVFCESTQVFIPNVFTPDGDGLNDVLMVRGTGIRTVKSFRIFNRWGELVFERSNFTPNERSNGWDGKVRGVPASPDVYVYTCEVVCDNNVPFIYKGNVTLVK